MGFGFTFLTWNLAMMERSDFAPANWRIDQTEAAVRDLVMRLDPDVVLFQELPGMVPFIETHDMAPANTRGQTGDIATLVRHSLMPGLTATTSENAVLVHFANTPVTLANVHLPSGKGGANYRKYAVQDIKKDCATDELLVLGDTNTRTREEKTFRMLGLTGKRPPEPTWNGRISKYRHGARAYTAYFTRAFHTKGMRLTDMQVITDPIKQGTKSFHISDHFPLLGRFEVK